MNAKQWFLLLCTFMIFKHHAMKVWGSCLDDNEFDYIVVGSGSTGGPIASRLSETPNVRVLLIEAGVEPIHVSEIPLLCFKALRSEMDWNYTSVPQKNCCRSLKKETIPIYRGKALGGTSSINFMTYTRGFREDYNNWKELGNDGWSWDDLFPYMLKLEDYRPPIPDPLDEPFHHKGGPMTVELPSFKTPIADVFLEAGVELGYPKVDYNGRNQIGFMYPPVNTRDGSRCSTWVAYIQPALRRSNFILESNALVTKILINETKVATGVRYEKLGQECTATARREVILSAGVIGSPKLLLLSGIGPKEDLEKLGIDVQVDLPGVGENYQDHVMVAGMEFLVNESITFNGARYETDEYLEQFEYNRTGPMTCPASFEGVAYLATNQSESGTWPNIEIFFNSDDISKTVKPLLKRNVAMILPPPDWEVITLIPYLLRPRSRGHLKLKNKDPYEDPLIDPNMLSHPRDVEILMEGVRIVNKLIRTEAFQRHDVSNPATTDMIIVCPTNETIETFMDDSDWIQCFMKNFAASALHPAGTCKMGPDTDNMAVVDNKLKVKGVKQLRVADASVMPNVVASHTSIPCVVIGEKIADEIKREWGDPITPPEAPDPIYSL